MTSSPKLVVIGYTNIDVNITPSSTSTLPGGAGYFTAVAASRILHPVGLVTRVGYDFDTHFLLSRVIADGVKIISDKQTAKSTQIYHSDTDLTQRDIELEWGVAQDLVPTDIPKGWLKSASIIHIGTMPPAQQKLFLDFLSKKKVTAKISIDTDHYLFKDQANIAQIKANFSRADIVFANRLEYRELKDIIDTRPQALLKKDHEGGEYREYGQLKYQAKAPQVTVLDATGAGDVFAGTFLSSQILGKSIPESVDLAIEVASKSVTQEGIKHLFA